MAVGEEEHSKSPDDGNQLQELEEKSSNDQTEEKDPRIRARKYQLELCKKAVDENIIVCLGTGCGKTHIAVLLIYELRHLIKRPQKSVCVFLAPTIPLVRQQASVIEESTNFKVGSYYGNCKHMGNHQEWEKKIEEYEVLVMTPQILLYNLLHRLIKMELIALLIFDECHHAQSQSNHPYAQIMKEYKTNATKRPRIFGMTASPIIGKGGANPDDLPRGINSLENLLEAKVYSVEDTEELERFVASPKLKFYYYGPVGDCSVLNSYLKKLEEIKNQKCIRTLRGKTEDVKVLRNNKKVLQRLQDNLLFCLESLGLWGAVQAVEILLTGDHSDLIDMIDTKSDQMDILVNQYLSQAASVVDSDLGSDGAGFDSSVPEALKDPSFSKKLLVLIEILSSCRSFHGSNGAVFILNSISLTKIQPDMKCIIFVNRIIVARTLSYLLRKLKCLSFWKSHFLVGSHSGLRSMSRKNMHCIVEKFRSGELNLLVATRVGEEGLDIQSCCLVIRFDLPETVASFIQSRGRARMPQSEYAFLVERGNQNELNLISNFLSEEDRMNKEITCRTSGEMFDALEEATYRVPSTGASIGAGYSVTLLHRYCSRLPHDEFFVPKPEFFYYDEKGGIMCRIILPSNAPVHQVDSPPQSSKEKAKKIACLRACKELHVLGALTDHLLPVQDDELDEESIEPDTCEDEKSREQLHEMLSPSILRNSWMNSEHSVLLNFYFIKLSPVPNDRLYQKFGLFVKAPFPLEAKKMELDLHLAHGRVVKTELVPLGLVEYCAVEITQAENFQELFLKIILDREDFFADTVSLGRNESQLRPSTFFLLLPVEMNKDEGSLTVDWKLIRRCLSSPVFKGQKDVLNSGNIPDGDSLILADGLAGTSDIVNSLIFTPHNKLFFFIDDVLHGLNANSPFTDHSSSNYVDHYAQKFGISILHPKQALLKAKQLFSLHNLLHNRLQENTEARELDEHFVELPPELCSLKIIGFSKDIGSSLSLLPSLMHRLENLLVAIELKSVFSHSFQEGSQVTAHHVLEAITTEKCMERFSLERFEVLGDAFLKYAVGRHVFLLHDALDEGQLTGKRSSYVNNSHLYKLAIKRNLQVYIRDENFDPSQFFALGRPCAVDCNQETKMFVHCQHKSGCGENESTFGNVKCRLGHHWLHRKTIADVVEALVGAFIVDSGFKAAIAFLKWIGIEVDFEASQVSKLCLASKSYMSLSNHIDTLALEKSLGYIFMHKGLLLQAYVHPSYNKHLGGCYQRLEFLGDAVLDYLITSYLYSVYPKLKPGQLTDLRSVTVNNNVFARVAVGRPFHKYLISDSSSLSEAVQNFVSSSKMSPARQDVTEGPKCLKALGDLVESSVGAILLDSGFNLNLVWEIVLSFLDPIMSFSSFQLNPVRELTELCQSRSWDMQFSSSKKGGSFTVNASVTGSNVHSTGHGTNASRKAAMRIAARKIFLKLKAQGYTPNKSKSLEKLLKSSRKEDAKLIGYDETPTQGDFHDIIQLENLQTQDCSPASLGHILNTQTVNKELADIPRSRQPISTVEAPEEHHCKITKDASSVFLSNNEDILPMASAKSRLFEICSANYWKAPTFELLQEEGPSHLKLFTFKVIVEIVGTPNTILECFSEPRPKKKEAEEHAAEGALWYLQPTKITSSEPLLKSQEVKFNHNNGTPILSGKQEVKLMHCDENPTIGYSKVEGKVASYSGESNVVNKEPADLPSCSRQVETPEKQYCEIKTGAKASLFEICSARSWKPPVFELVKEEGEDHLKLFSMKVVVEILGDSGSSTIIECFSDPSLKKKLAEEYAAQGALWYLRHYKEC